MLPTQYMARALYAEDNKQRLELKSTREIEFSQVSVAPTFMDGSSVAGLTSKLISGEIDILSIPPIRVVYTQRRWFTLDNRRLRAFKDAFMPKIPVVVSDFSDPNIKKEFFSKKTNKSITEGGTIRAYAEKWDEHFDSGVFCFTKRVLNWNFEQLSEPLPNMKYKEPLPAKFFEPKSYYSGFLDLILEEARASLQSGVEASEKSKVENLALTLLNVKKSKKAQNPSTLIFSKQPENAKNKAVIKPSDAYLLEYGANNVQTSLKLLALVSYAPNEETNRVTFKVVFDEMRISEIPQALEKQAKWQAKPLGSLVTHMRMFDVCTATPNVSWLDPLLTGDLQNQIVSPANVSPAQYPVTLNDSQKVAMEKFLNLRQGLQLVQGPPGTGKTSMVVELLKLLVPQGKILVCAPSNKAIQVLADRFSFKYPDVPVILNGVEDKLPKDHDRLQEIFIHTWAPSKLAHLLSMKEALWTLLPDSVFTGTPQQIKCKISKACETITSIQKDFLKLEAKLIKYNILCLNKEDIERFILANKKYIDLVSNDLIFYSALSNFLAKEKVIDHISEALLESNLMSFFNNMKKPLMEISEILTKIEYYLNNVDIEAHLLNYSPIIFSTLSVSGRKSLKELSKIESLIIDEAGQAVEAETLIPLFTQPKKCLLIGDPKQLPATVLSQLSTELNFERSMMSRLIEDCKQAPSMLTTQYRMHPEIRYWPSAQYYGSKLQDGQSILQRPVLMENAPPFLAPYAFINLQGRETSSGHSFENRLEVEFIVKLIYHLEATFQVKAASDVGIITFYKGQALLLQESLKHSHPKVKIQTVDSFQGDENNIIIISFVRSNPFGNVGFIKDFRRLNVALTRAKHALILVGNANTLEKGQNDVALLIKDVKERKCFFEQNAIEKFLVGAPKKINNNKPNQYANIKKPAVCHYFNGNPHSCNKGDQCDFLHTNHHTLQKQQVPLKPFKRENKRDDKSVLDVPVTIKNQNINLQAPLDALQNQVQCLTLHEQTTSAAIAPLVSLSQFMPIDPTQSHAHQSALSRQQAPLKPLKSKNKKDEKSVLNVPAIIENQIDVLEYQIQHLTLHEQTTSATITPSVSLSQQFMPDSTQRLSKTHTHAKKPSVCHYFNGKPNSCNKGDQCDFSHTNQTAFQRHTASLKRTVHESNRDKKISLDIPGQTLTQLANTTSKNKNTNMKESRKNLKNQKKNLKLNEQTTPAPFFSVSQPMSQGVHLAYKKTSHINKQPVKKPAVCHYFNGNPNSCNKGTQCDFLHTSKPGQSDLVALRKK